MTNLFRHGNFKLSSGSQSNFKIDCDALTDDDWVCLAHLAVSIVGSFSHAVGVPTGGEKFAQALNNLDLERHPKSPILIVDDVYTTGKSIEEVRLTFDASIFNGIRGVVVFARTVPMWWVIPIFQLMPANETYHLGNQMDRFYPGKAI